jgi:hypothetical protein
MGDDLRFLEGRHGSADFTSSNRHTKPRQNTNLETRLQTLKTACPSRFPKKQLYSNVKRMPNK